MTSDNKLNLKVATMIRLSVERQLLEPDDDLRPLFFKFVGEQVDNSQVDVEGRKRNDLHRQFLQITREQRLWDATFLKEDGVRVTL